MKVNANLYAKMIALLVDSPQTTEDIAAETGLHPVTVGHYIRELRKAGLLAVGAWEKDTYGRECRPVYEWGRKRDKPRTKLTQAEKSAAYKARQKERMTLRRMAGMVDAA